MSGPESSPDNTMLEFIRRRLQALGTVQIMVGVMLFLLGSILWRVSSGNTTMYYCVFILAALLYIIAGSLTVAADRSMNRCLIKGSIRMSIVAAVMSVIITILIITGPGHASPYTKKIDQYCDVGGNMMSRLGLDCRAIMTEIYQYVMDGALDAGRSTADLVSRYCVGIMSQYDCREIMAKAYRYGLDGQYGLDDNPYTAYRKLPNGVSGVLCVFILLAFTISICVSIFGCKAENRHPPIHDMVPLSEEPEAGGTGSVPGSSPYNSLLKFKRSSPQALGTVEIMVGVMLLLFGVVSCFVYITLPVLTGVFIWAPICYIIAGSLTVAADRSMNRCLIKGSMGMNIVAAVMAFAAILIYGVDVAVIQLDSRLYQDLAMGLSAVLSVFNLLVFIIAIRASAFGCKAVCCQPMQVVVIGSHIPEGTVMSLVPHYPNGPSTYPNVVHLLSDKGSGNLGSGSDAAPPGEWGNV